MIFVAGQIVVKNGKVVIPNDIEIDVIAVK